MKTLPLAILALSFAFAAQAGIRNDPQSENSGRPDVTATYIGRDFAPLLMPKSQFIGFMGADFQRLKIRFSSVTKDASDPAVYRITGSSEVKANRCTLNGTITVTALKGAKTGILRDENGKDLGVSFEGSMYGRYDIKESGPAAWCGAFRGTVRLDWYIDRQDLLRYDDVDAVSDGYNNNQYEGTWTSAGGKTKVANWGEYRIPEGDGLDCGAAEFAPCDKYRDKGWDGYKSQKWTP